MLLDNQTTTIVIVAGVVLVAVIALLVGKNPNFSMFGVKFGATENDRQARETNVANKLEVGEHGSVDVIVGTKGAAVDGPVTVANGAHIDGKVGRIVGQQVGAPSKESDDV